MTPPRKRRAWTIILVPPKPDAQTRQVTISTRTVAGIATLALAMFGGAATYTGEQSNYAAMTASRLAESQRTVVTLLDSVQVLAALAERASKLPPKDMLLPVAGHISSGFSRARMHPIMSVLRSHQGVDLAAPTGTPIVAAAAGKVRYVGWRLGYGLTVELEHSGEVITRYAHCREATVRVGDPVVAGDPIATVGSSGVATGPHVHFEVIAKGQSVDPIKFLASTRVATAAIEQARTPGASEDR